MLNGAEATLCFFPLDHYKMLVLLTLQTIKTETNTISQDSETGMYRYYIKVFVPSNTAKLY